MKGRRLVLISAGDFFNAIDEAMNTTPKLTPWFPPTAKPARVGEYNASPTRAKQLRRWWNGRQWSESYFDTLPPADKERARRTPSLLQALPWRGLRHPGA